jgi:hypothetical protein
MMAQESIEVGLSRDRPEYVVSGEDWRFRRKLSVDWGVMLAWQTLFYDDQRFPNGGASRFDLDFGPELQGQSRAFGGWQPPRK